MLVSNGHWRDDSVITSVAMQAVRRYLRILRTTWRAFVALSGMPMIDGGRMLDVAICTRFQWHLNGSLAKPKSTPVNTALASQRDRCT
jgi:hypothetical protein